MTDKFTDKKLYRDTRDRFSVAPLQKEIDDRFEDPASDAYSVRELHRLRSLAVKALQLADKRDVYGAEVFVTANEDDFVFHVDPEGDQPKISFDEGATIHGYVRNFEVTTLPDYDSKKALAARVEEMFEDTAETQSYLVPLAIEGVKGAPRLHDAPVPVMESDTDMALKSVYSKRMKDQRRERDEQDVQRSLLNIIEQDLFDSEHGVSSTRQLTETLGSMIDEGFVEDCDDFATAMNYYLAKRAHDNDAVYLAVDDVEMSLIDGPVGEVIEPRLIDDRLELMGVNFEVDEEMQVTMTVYCGNVTDEGIEILCSKEAETEDWEFTTEDVEDTEY